MRRPTNLKRLFLSHVTALAVLGALPAVSSAQLAPGSGREEDGGETQTVVQPFIGNNDRTFVTEVFLGSDTRAPGIRFFTADGAGTESSRRLIEKSSIPEGDREVLSQERNLRQTERECFIAYLRDRSVDVQTFGDREREPGDNDDDDEFDATSGRVCVTVRRSAQQRGDGGDDSVPARLYLVGRRGVGPRSATFGRPYYKPRTLRTRSNALVVRIRWKNWTRSSASGIGTARVAVGGGAHRRVRGARLLATGLTRGRCQGLRAFYYTRVRVINPRGSGLPRIQRFRLAGTCSPSVPPATD